jgi:phosphate uptake regulator
MWKDIVGLFKKDSLSDEAFADALLMLEVSEGMFKDSVASLRKEAPLEDDIYARDKQLNKFEREVRRKIVSHLAVSTHPDITLALVLTSIVIDIERIGDFTKNIVELATNLSQAFDGGELDDDISTIEETVSEMMEDIAPALGESDVEKARRILERHGEISGMVDKSLQALVSGEALAGSSGQAVTAALYLRYLKRVSAHVKNVATSIVNPYHRIGFREKDRANEEDQDSESD